MKRKKIMLHLLFILALLSFSNVTATGQAALCGDVNDDGAVNIVDALLTAQCYVGLAACADEAVGDVNCDSQINIVDALLIAQLYVGSITGLQCCNTTATPTPTPNTTPRPGSNAVEFSRQMGAGWNLGNSMESMGPGNETAWGNPKVTQSFVNAVKAAGFDTLRIPVAWSVFTDQANYIIDTAWLNRVEEVVNYGLNAGMYVIINEHWDGGWLNHPFYSNRDSLNHRLAVMWEQIADHFRAYDNRLLFAGTNEVMNDGDYSTPTQEYVDVQNSFNQTFVTTVRGTGGNNADRYLIVQGFNTNIDHTVEFAVIPNDTVTGRLMMEVHYYDPYNFTLNTSSNINEWPSSEETWANEAWCDGQMEKMRIHFVDRGIAVILGEYGVASRQGVSGFETSRVRWNRYVTEAAAANDIVPIYWDNGVTGDTGLGLFDRNSGAIVYPNIVNAIVNSVD
ncbi:MAG: cellulase family glycosylhydrolase [Spirochaetales bacterium]|nr:cellulase family glycosylhydrolase [Spirochaetales bacterium]